MGCAGAVTGRVLTLAAALVGVLGCSSEAAPTGRMLEPGRSPAGAGAGAGPGGDPGAAGLPSDSGDGFGNASQAMQDIVVPVQDGVEGGECGAVSQMAENKLQPVDIIFGVDTSGSMAEEVAQVQQNLNTFSQQIIDSGIDVRVIMLATQQGSALLAGGAAVDGPCIAPPLGSGQCPMDSNPPTYQHLNQPVTSWDVLDVYINAYPSYKPHLRENSLKTFVTISDDNADSSTSPFAILGIQPTIHSASAFVDAVENLEPGSSMWADWRYSGIYSFTMCPSAQFGAVGVVHEELVQMTGGVAGDLCLQEFAPVFDELAKQVAEAVTLACDWDIPPSPNGDAFDKGKTNVELRIEGNPEQLLKVADGGACGGLEGWHYNDEAAPTKVVACPATCDRIQAAASAQVDLLFGCETVTVK